MRNNSKNKENESKNTERENVHIPERDEEKVGIQTPICSSIKITPTKPKSPPKSPKSLLYKNLHQVLKKVSSGYEGNQQTDQDTIYLKVEENSGIKMSMEIDDRYDNNIIIPRSTD